MTKLVRVIEKLTGTPHRHDNADRVHRAAVQVSQAVDGLNATLKPYTKTPDPLVALLTDIFNNRQMKDHDWRRS